MIKAIIFDCFNVLIRDATKHLVEEMNQTYPIKRQEFSAVTHAVDKGIISDIEGAQAQSELLGLTVQEFIEIRNKGEVRNEPLIEYIKTLKGKYKLMMLSNIVSRERLDSRFLPGQLDELFEEVIPSGEVGYIKPQPELFILAAERLGLRPEECVMIDDIADFCEGARAVGMQAIQFLNNEQAITDLNALIDRGEKRD
jgi:haloacid dehalogenase superfamily, subfamily IA, variant 3 with third motif having DD or ED/haloacid dehalogenase superfamily, subfamily IA, variant 1 with third motif having Dx(3-4)D or Dx(3-4)E